MDCEYDMSDFEPVEMSEEDIERMLCELAGEFEFGSKPEDVFWADVGEY